LTRSQPYNIVNLVESYVCTINNNTRKVGGWQRRFSIFIFI